MAEITVVDINELTATISKSKDMLLAVEVSGTLYKITKENFFKLLGQQLDFATSAGLNPIITLDGSSGNQLIYINDGGQGILLVKIGVLGVSANGTTNICEMTTGGVIRAGLGAVDGLSQLLEDAELYEFTGRDLEQNVFVDLDIQNTETSEAIECGKSIMYLEVDSAGTIASHTIQFPALARVGYTFEFYVKGTITALTCEGGLVTVTDPLTTVTTSGAKWVRVVTGGGGGTASWRRLR